MATVPVFTTTGEKAGEFELAAAVFGLEANAALVHQAVLTTLANNRQGTADTLTRGEVHHTTRKMFRQKGTGRARQGMRSAPHWKGGGIAFGPHPRDYSVSLPKKMRRKALLCALSSRAQGDALKVVEGLGVQDGKTKEAVALLKALGIADLKKVLLIVDSLDEMTIRAFRNLPNIGMVTPESLGTYDVLDANVLVFTRTSLEALQTLKQQPIGSARWLAKQGGVA